MDQATKTPTASTQPEILRSPRPGDTVLFCVREDPLCLRPLMVTSTLGMRVHGVLLFDGPNDRYQPWTQHYCKTPPDPTHPFTWAGADHGQGLGEWRYQDEGET
jgi:hypothetical protein